MSFLNEAWAGLSAPRKTIPPKYFYDKRGSELFEQICTLQEYYVTRIERALLADHAGEIARLLGRGCSLVEYGSGASTKTKILLDHMEDLDSYIPVDISKEFLLQTARELQKKYPRLKITPVCADFTSEFEVPRTGARAVGFFPGSTIGNLHPVDAEKFLRTSSRFLGTGGALLIGVDRVKDARVLERAYDDSAGVTAAFNLNLLERMNRELGADFSLGGFQHRALFNETEERVEMHLVSRRNQEVRIGDRLIRFADGETIHTENSYKYRPEKFRQLARNAGFELERSWSDANGWFTVYLFRAVVQSDEIAA